MVTTFNAKDMTSFATYVLSKKRTDLIKSNYEENDNISLEERLMQVYHADFENWKFEQETKNKSKRK